MDGVLILTLLVLGVGSGYTAGLLGIGGGMVMVPFTMMIFTARHFAPELILHMAIATSLGTVLFTSMSSVRAHHAHGAVLWPVVARMAPGILLGAWLGPWIGKQMNTSLLTLVFGLFMLFSATQMLLNRKPTATRQLPASPGLIVTGGIIGVAAGLVGAGGGFLSVPFMGWCNVRIHNAVATSAALGFPLALAATLSNIYFGWNAAGLPPYSFGYIYLPALLVMAAASVTMAPLGARMAHSLPVVRLKRIFAGLLYVLAVYMLWKAAH